MVTRRRGSSDSSLNPRKRLCGPIGPDGYRTYDDEQMTTARSKSEACQNRGKERNSADHEPHPRRIRSYTHHDTGHPYSASTGWQCSIYAENTTLPTLAQALASTRELLPWPDTEKANVGSQHYLAPLPIAGVAGFAQTGMKLSHDAFDNAIDDEPKGSIESPASDRPRSRTHSPMMTYSSLSLESSVTPDPGSFMTVVADNEVPSAYVDFALFMMERGTALYRWVQDAKARLQAMQARISVLETQEARAMALYPT